jgi:hypothetical protein
LKSSAIARRVRLVTVAGGVAILFGSTAIAVAQDISINLGQGGSLTES